MATAVVAANYLKIAGASIYAFDYIQTIPAELRFYRRQKGFMRLNLACWLLISVRYLGMVGIIMSMVGGFSTTFTLKSCSDFFLAVPMVKVFAAVASQAVFIFRTYAICGRSRTVLYALLVIGGLLSVAEIVSPIVVARTPKLGATGNCISDLSKGSTSWIQYLCQVVFDIIILGLTTNRLFRGADKKTRSEFTRILWESQVMYFLAVTIMNILNLVFFIKFNKSSESTMFATLGIAVTSIFSGHVILDLHEVGNGPRSYLSSGGGMVAAHNANGVHTTTYRNGEVVDRQFRVVTVSDPTESTNTKSDAYRMSSLQPGGIRVQREVLAIVDSDEVSNGSEWERKPGETDDKRRQFP